MSSIKTMELSRERQDRRQEENKMKTLLVGSTIQNLTRILKEIQKEDAQFMSTQVIEYREYLQRVERLRGLNVTVTDLLCAIEVRMRELFEDIDVSDFTYEEDELC